eukprot:GHVH01014756.1.p1 GENE.GHVH01014756.1~~GHVH01014756.1.p1  ORF type:complete len:652 (-),score=84.96 GHVH01014756.1:1117-3072(-)
MQVDALRKETGIQDIPKDICDKYGSPTGDFKFKCRKGIDRWVILLSSKSLRVVKRRGSCRSPVMIPSPVDNLKDSLSSSVVHPYDQLTKLQRKAIKRTPCGNMKDVNRELKWSSLQSLVTTRKSAFECYIRFISSTSPPIQVFAKSHVIFIIINTIKSFYYSVCGRALEHQHQSTSTLFPVKVTKELADWRSPIAAPHRLSMAGLMSPPPSSLYSFKRYNILNHYCQPKDDQTEVSDEELNEQNELSNSSNSFSFCPICGNARGEIPLDPVTSIRTVDLPDSLLSNPSESIATDSIKWVQEPKVVSTVPLPIDVMAKLFVLNQPMPSSIGDDSVHSKKGGLLHFITYDKTGDKKTIAQDEVVNFSSSVTFAGVADALTGVHPIVPTPESQWAAPRAVPIKMSTRHPIPDNFIINKLIRLLPAVPVESIGIESVKLIHCSPRLVVIDWTEYIIGHIDANGNSIDSGIAASVLHGGLQPIFRMIFSHSQLAGSAGARCTCCTDVATNIGFRHNDKKMFERDTCMKMPKGFKYTDSVKSGLMWMAQSLMGKQEALETSNILLEVVKKEIQHLRSISDEERSLFLAPIRPLSKVTLPEVHKDEESSLFVLDDDKFLRSPMINLYPTVIMVPLLVSLFLISTFLVYSYGPGKLTLY